MKCNVLVPEVVRHHRDCKKPWFNASENYLRHTDTSSRLSDAGLADTTLPNLGRVPRNMFIERSTYLIIMVSSVRSSAGRLRGSSHCRKPPPLESDCARGERIASGTVPFNILNERSRYTSILHRPIVLSIEP